MAPRIEGVIDEDGKRANSLVVCYFSLIVELLATPLVPVACQSDPVNSRSENMNNYQSTLHRKV